MNRVNFLFRENDLDSVLRARQDAIPGAVGRIGKEQFIISSNKELIDHIAPEFIVNPICLHESQTRMKQNEVRVDVSHDRNRIFGHDQSGPFYIPGTRVEIEVPFSGDSWIFQYRTNPFSMQLPQGGVAGGILTISIELPHDAAPTRFKSEYDSQIALIRECVARSTDQIERHNQAIPGLIDRAITQRRSRLGKHSEIAALLDIPLATRANAPSIVPVKLEIRRPSALPVPPRSGLAPEPGISDSTFEHILHFIRHQGRTFERTPATFSVHGEEDLRNIILAQLNGHFEGAAVGESFRGKGKTDILIEEGSRAAFVGECKVWTGPAGLSDAIDQLLGYLTWRDSKSALLMFNTKNKEFSKILESMPLTIRAHPLFVKDLQNPGGGEWRVEMRSKEDAGRRVAVHCFVFDIFPK
jgi:hypothetical protein